MKTCSKNNNTLDSIVDDIKKDFKLTSGLRKSIVVAAYSQQFESFMQKIYQEGFNDGAQCVLDNIERNVDYIKWKDNEQTKNMNDNFRLSEDLIYQETENFVTLLKFELMRIADIKDTDKKDEALLNVIEELSKNA